MSGPGGGDTLRCLTVPPTSDGWVALPDRFGCSGDVGCWNPVHEEGCYGERNVLAVGDVLGLVERCECGGTDRGLRRDGGCHLCYGTGHLLVGTVTVGEVRAIVALFNSAASMRGRCYLGVSGLFGDCWLIDGSGNVIAEVDLPNAVPGGVAIRVEPCECPVTDEELINHTGPCWLCEDLPRPVALTGDAPIQTIKL